ncbi:trafficking protein particle complex subunit 8 [Nilaparvata lugens]|uniref:trafficking protein particle complex subunit 8 n=1 Tax=Nilaparvata lugens TaxID=108931 RepID=UPI00193D83A9|nr:trafficking protein particle complex subunit 8 [Nilaparvata lugens]
MANLKLSSYDFIQNSFCPLIATFCSPKVDQTCRKNNLSFTELVQPFCKIGSEAYVQDSTGSSITVKNLRLNLIDVHSQPPQPTKARKLLNDSVSLVTNERLTTCEIGSLLLEVPTAFPWFESWRETFLQVQFPSDHEFLKHYLGCILVVSSKESNPSETLARMEEDLAKMQNLPPNTLPKWFSPTNILRYYVLLHDSSDTHQKVSETVFEGMCTTYGAKNCFLLRINSQPPTPLDNELTDPWIPYINKNISSQDNVNDNELDNHISSSTGSLETGQEADEHPVILHPLSPVSETQNIIMNSNSYDKNLADGGVNNNLPRVQHGACLTTGDLDQIRQMINEFCVNALLPHIEVHIAQLSFIISNKKGVSRSLLSATKRWFGSNKPGTHTNALPPTSVMYSADSPEIQQRRLGDLYMMVQAYPQAYSAYHSAKRDFHADGAWLHYAGALEMASLALLMQPGDQAIRKAHDYADESIHTYQNSCRMPQFATRATLFSVECLRARGMHGEAAKQLIRMTCEDSDLRSALLLEQAAHCFLQATRPCMPRKYAFHLVLAGHRFSKAGQKRHALRCYRQAHQVYEGKNWSLAEDHIHFTIGRMAAGLKRGQEAAEAYARLLPRASRQGAAQQASFLNEYLITQQEVSIETGEIPVLPLPVIDGNSIQVLLDSAPQPVSSPNAIPASGLSFQLTQEENTRWCKLEEQAVNVAFEGQAFVFKPTIELLNNTTNNANPVSAYVNEEISVSVCMENPLHIALALRKVRLLWSLIPADGGLCQDNQPQPGVAVPAHAQLAACSQALDLLTIEPDSAKNVILKVTPKRTGELKITGVGYSVVSGVEGGGAGGAVVAGRQHLVVPPRMHVRTPNDLRGLQAAVDSRLTLNIVDSLPHLGVTLEGLRSDVVCGEVYAVQVELTNCGCQPISRILVASSAPHLVSIGTKCWPSGQVCSVPLASPLAPGQRVSERMLLRAPDARGQANLHLLFYYESAPQQRSRPRYRLVRHCWPLTVYESLHISALATRSCSSSHTSETMNIRLSVENNNQVHDPLLIQVSLQQVSLFSHKWKMCSNTHCPKESTIDAQETVHLLLQACKKLSESGKPELSSVTLNTESKTSPCLDFIDRGTDEETSAGPENDLTLQSTLVLIWKGSITENGGSKRVVEGQHHLRLSRLDESVSWPPDNCPPVQVGSDALCLFGPPEARPQSQLFKQRLLTFRLNHPTTVSHDFKLNRICIVPVKVEARNCCDNTLAVKFEAKGPLVSSHKGQLYSPRPASCFQWVGQTAASVELEGRARYDLSLAVVLTAPGAYDLGAHLTVSVAISHLSAELVPQTWRPEAILIVNT